MSNREPLEPKVAPSGNLLFYEREENLPVSEKNSLPSEKSFVYQIPEPKELFPEEYMQKLIDYFAVTPEDVIKAPILPHKAMSGSDAASVAEKNTKEAYRKILADRITDFLYDNIPAAREKAVDFILNNKEGILEKTIAGCFSDYLEEIIDGTPVIGSDGEPLMVRKNRYSNEKAPSKIHTSKRDGTPRRRQELLDWPQMPAVFWIGESETGDWKPPVLWKLQFQDAAGYALLFGVREEELDDIFRLSGYLRTFWTENERTFFYTLLGRPGEEKRNNQGNIQVPRLADINFCMTKRYRRKLIKERENKSVGGK